MKCIMCKICQAAHAAVERKLSAWLAEQMNSMEIWNREADQEAIHHAHSLMETDPDQAFREYLALAQRGSVWSMIHVAWAYETGTGTPADPAQAEAWYRRAYAGGSQQGLLGLGHIYLRAKEYAKAEEVFRTGAERGWAPAMHCLAWAMAKSPEWREKRAEIRALLERAAALGDISAKHCLGHMLMRGRFGLRNIPKGIRLVDSAVKDMVALLKEEDIEEIMRSVSESDRWRWPKLRSFVRLRLFGAGSTPAATSSASVSAAS